MVATSGACVPAIGHEFFSTQAGFESGLVQKFGVLNHFTPIAGRVNVDFNHARVGCDLQELEPWVSGRRISFQHNGDIELLGCGFYGRQQMEVIVDFGQGRHEDIHHALHVFVACGIFPWHGPIGTSWVSNFYAQSGSHGGGIRLKPGRCLRMSALTRILHRWRHCRPLMRTWRW